MRPVPHSNRRDFLLASAGLGLGAVTHASAARAPRLPQGDGKRLLVLGGTRFLGPQIVRNALEAGWEVTLFNRGKSNPHLFPELEKLVGDRNESHDALKNGEWDAAIDTSGYIPHHVLEACEVLKDRCGHYVFVSTLSVYESGQEGVLDEEAPVGQVEPDKMEEFQVIGDIRKFGMRYYGPLKALCEEAAESAMPGRVSNVRPGLIVGPEDSTDRFTYWPVRVNQGGEVLAPGDPDVGIQVIDVRDLGTFCFHLARERTPGVLNAVGFEGQITMQELLHGAKLVTGSDCTFTWVPDDFLLAQSVGPWMELPLWIPGGGNVYDNRRAFDAGMKLSPLGDTIRVTLDWHLAERGPDYTWRGAGLAAEKEAKVLAAWHEQNG